MFLQCLPLKTSDAFSCEKNCIIQVVQNKDAFDRSNIPINEGVKPEASYHLKKNRRTKLKKLH